MESARILGSKCRVLFFICILLVGIFDEKLYSQNDTLYFRHFNVDNGLSHRNVSSIIQDSLGFMWYGTAEGLSMFDGYKFFPFKHDPKNPNSLVSDEITCLTVEKSGIIWIGTKNKGLNRYDPYTGKFDLFEHSSKQNNSISDNNITSLFSDSTHHLIWIGTKNGLNVYDPILKTFKIHKHSDTSTLSNNSVSCIKMDATGRIWIGTDGGGLNLFDVNSVKFSYLLHAENDPNSISSDHIKDIFADKKNTIWIATSNGLNQYDFKENKITVYKHDNADRFSISSDNLTSVYQDKYGKIWVGTANDGLSVYYPKTGKFIQYFYDKTVPNSLNSNKINSVSQGRSGMFWAATSNGGLNAFNPKTLKFNLFNPIERNGPENIYDDLSQLYVVKNKYLLLGTYGHGLFIYDLDQKILRNLLQNKKTGEVLAVNCMLDDNGVIWLGIENALMKYDVEKNALSTIEFKEKGLESGDEITVLYKDRSGLLWVGTNGKGLFSFNGSKKETRHYNSENKNTLIDNTITDILEDRNGNLWIGSENGLSQLNLKSGQFTNFQFNPGTKNSLGSNQINKLYLDSEGALWIGTKGGGLNKFNAATKEFLCFNTHHGLPGNSIGSIMEDHNHNYWIGSDYGICRLTFENDKLLQCRIFDLIDGLPTTEFCETKTCRALNGRVLFSCNKGLISFNPDSLRNNPFKPPVIISEFYLFNKKITTGDSTGLLKTSVSVTKAIYLNYDQNSFSFDFTAISFINAGKNKYAYILEGFDKDWNYRNAQNRNATYTNIDPGKYTFRVKASNNDGVWNDKGTAIILIIAAPFWKTWWFYSLFALSLMLIAYGIYYARLQNILRMQDVRNKISRDLHDQIGSTLSSISIYSEVAKKMVNEKAPEALPILEGLGESARSSAENMSDIVWAVNPTNDKFSNIVKRLQIIATQLMDAKEIDLKFDVPESLNDLKLSMEQRKNLYLILKEALNNVAKYSEAKHCIIKAEKTEKNVNIVIDDDGKGFESKSASLGGNGIINMKQRAVELNGLLNVFSEKNRGTKIVLEFQI